MRFCQEYKKYIYTLGFKVIEDGDYNETKRSLQFFFIGKGSIICFVPVTATNHKPTLHKWLINLLILSLS